MNESNDSELQRSFDSLKASLLRETSFFECAVFGKPFVLPAEKWVRDLFQILAARIDSLLTGEGRSHAYWFETREPDGTPDRCHFMTKRFGEQVKSYVDPTEGRFRSVFSVGQPSIPWFDGPKSAKPEPLSEPYLLSAYIVFYPRTTELKDKLVRQYEKDVVRLQETLDDGRTLQDVLFARTWWVDSAIRDEMRSAIHTQHSTRDVAFESYHIIWGQMPRSVSETVLETLQLLGMQFQREWGNRALLAATKNLARVTEQREVLDKLLFAFGHHLGNAFLEAGIWELEKEIVGETTEARQARIERLKVIWSLPEATRIAKLEGVFPQKWLDDKKYAVAANGRLPADSISDDDMVAALECLVLSVLRACVDPEKVCKSEPDLALRCQRRTKDGWTSIDWQPIRAIPSIPPFRQDYIGGAGSLAVSLGLFELLRNVLTHLKGKGSLVATPGTREVLFRFSVQIDAPGTCSVSVYEPVQETDNLGSTTLSEIMFIEGHLLKNPSEEPICTTSGFQRTKHTDDLPHSCSWARATWTFYWSSILWGSPQRKEEG